MKVRWCERSRVRRKGGSLGRRGLRQAGIREIAELDEADRAEMLASAGLSEAALPALAREAYRVLGLQSYFTAGEKEVRAWTIPIGATAPQAAGVIHSDFERGFIRVEGTPSPTWRLTRARRRSGKRGSSASRGSRISCRMGTFATSSLTREINRAHPSGRIDTRFEVTHADQWEVATSAGRPSTTAGTSGKRNTKRLPRPGSLSAVIDPPCASAMRRARPGPARSPRGRSGGRTRRDRRDRRRAKGLRRDAATAVLDGKHDGVPARPTLTTIAVPGSLYFSAFSSKLSTNWPRSGLCAGPERFTVATLKTEIGSPPVARPGLQMVRNPGGQIEVFQVGKPGLGVGSGQE